MWGVQTSSKDIAVYGAFNDQRLTGLHETASISDFSYSVSGEVLKSEFLLLLLRRMERMVRRQDTSNGDPCRLLLNYQDVESQISKGNYIPHLKASPFWWGFSFVSFSTY